MFSRKMVETARKLNPAIEVVLRTHSDEEAALLQNVGKVFMGEHELARGMASHVLERMEAGVSGKAGP